jgi:hypothetical protein
MKRRRATKAAKAENLIVGAPEIGRPTLGQSHRLVAIGIGGKKKRRRRAKQQEKVMPYLEKLRHQGHDLNKMKTSEIEHLLVSVWPDKNFSPRDTVNRALGRRKDDKAAK